jgi:hypothetical protein
MAALFFLSYYHQRLLACLLNDSGIKLFKNLGIAAIEARLK